MPPTHSLCRRPCLYIVNPLRQVTLTVCTALIGAVEGAAVLVGIRRLWNRQRALPGGRPDDRLLSAAVGPGSGTLALVTAEHANSGVYGHVLGDDGRTLDVA